MSNRALFGIVGFLIIAIVAVAIVAIVNNLPPSVADLPDEPVGFDGVTIIEPPVQAIDFNLVNTEGEPMTLADLEGKHALIAFGFTNCPDVCPLTLNEFRQVRDALGADATGIQFVFVSVDGNRDTPAILKSYFERNRVSDFVGLTGDADVVRAMGQPYDLRFNYGEPNAQGYYVVEHTAHYFLLDPNGQYVRKYNFGILAETLTDDLRSVLQG